MLRHIFPTYIFKGDATKLNYFSDLQKEIKEYLQTKEPNYLNWFGKTHKLFEKSFNIDDAQLLEHCPLLKGFVEDEIYNFLREIRSNEEVIQAIPHLKIGSSWATQFDEGDYAHQHNHLPDEISGVYYYQVPERKKIDEPVNQYEGYLYFVSPVQGHYFSPMTSPQQKLYITPEKGRLVLFPSYLEHAVMPCSNHDKARISISFNGSLYSHWVGEVIDERGQSK
tara:strand:- start:1102 stop:1773 length:672 start_codon:yes stop_codon:yes gene_type:complete